MVSPAFWGAHFESLLVVGTGTAELSGGVFSGILTVQQGGEVTISGGTFMHAGNGGLGAVAVDAGGKLNLLGLSFKINGREFQGLFGHTYVLPDRDVMLTGILGDGSPFAFPLPRYTPSIAAVSPLATLTITIVPEPTALRLVLSLIVFGLSIGLIQSRF